MRRTRTLHDGWTVTPGEGPVPAAVRAAGAIPAQVPGVVHTDLLAAGLIADPYLDANERDQHWIGLTEWRYTTRFSWAGADERADLVFEGLDTVARIELNGVLVGETANMHRTYRFDVTALLRPDNHLTVTFASAVRHADAASLALEARPHVNHHPFNAIRKMACNFGWDWGPDVVTAGIWRAVSLQTWDVARLATVRPVVAVDGPRGTVDVHVELERLVDAPLTVTAEVAEVRASAPVARGASATVVRLTLDDVARWWPRGYGDQPLYDLAVTLSDDGNDGGAALDAWTTRIGFRDVRLDTSADDAGTRFTFVVNDVPVFVKGANWIPDDCFPHRVSRERYVRRLRQAEEAGLNLVRVWGGGIFESDDFYAECDERGLLVWQDFLFACACYAEEEPLRSEVLAEARDNVVRLLPHPSLALWNGCNENLWGFADWGWQQRLDGKTWGAGYYHELLPALCAELDPLRPYAAGSPWSVDGAHHPNDPAHGTMHIWDVWNAVDYGVYRDYRPRFVAEFGWQGPPAWATLTRALSDDPLTPESPGMLVHQKATEGNKKLEAGLVPHLRVPDDMEDWHWAMQLNQARAIRLGVEWFRSLQPHCMGSVVWQLNDCWPVTSWAAVDGDERRKPLFHALQQAHADRLLTVQPSGDGGLVVATVNDTPAPWSGQLEMIRYDGSGAVLAHETVPLSVEARAVVTVPVPATVAVPGDPSYELLVVRGRDEHDGTGRPATAGDGSGWTRGVWFYAEDRDGRLPAQDVTVDVTPAERGVAVTVTARALVRDLTLLVDKVDPDAVVSGGLATLLPGESVTWHVRASKPLDAVALREPRVLRSANQLV